MTLHALSTYMAELRDPHTLRSGAAMIILTEVCNRRKVNITALGVLLGGSAIVNLTCTKDALVSGGYVEEFKRPEDRREVWLKPTKKGDEKVRQAMRAAKNEEKKA